MIDVLCVGNAIIDAFLTIHEANEHCRWDHEHNEFCFKAGEKVPLETANFQLGGNACNVAVGLARLGLRSSLVAEVGKEPFAHTIRQTLEKEGVHHEHVFFHDSPSSFAVGINFKGERTLFVHHVERSHAFSYEGISTKWVYLSSMGEKWRHVYKEVPAFVKRSGAKLAFNPGTRQIAAGTEAIESALEVSDIVFLNKEEAEKLIETVKGLRLSTQERSRYEEIKELSQHLQQLGPKLVVITDGTHGSFALDSDGHFHHQKILSGEVVERTGAGDSYATGFLAARIYAADIKTAMIWGSLNAAGVVSKVGAQPGLLTKDALEKKLHTV